jgi:adenylate cyclase
MEHGAASGVGQIKFFRKTIITIMKRLKRFFSPSYASITLLISALVVLFFLISVPFLDLMELQTIDLRFLSRGSIPSSGLVAMAMVDEKSLDAEGRWPWA